ncbi:hypothetical protein K435DRAFT_860188 [Dendrothele bispora CBS 962.96]|uniref:Uncharacterized protein n=1 Tax=Dendrothele bispora (strain CBS 962.96) TaxID=1314807 RepID=A0A4S8LZR3_DENBC|nr:hypothetical protein K435DRAFT_860188 [Dendrothele bispora CBS 962.96]
MAPTQFDPKAMNNSFQHSTINNVIGDQHLHNIYQLSDDKVKEIRAWINPPDSSTNYVTACDKMTEGTGLWLIQDERFRKWMKNGNLLWLQGKDPSAAATPTPAAKKHRGRPPKPKKAVVEAEPGTPPSTPASPIHLPEPVKNFSAVIHVLKPDTITRNRGKNKVVKHDPEVRGPVHAPIDVSFKKLLDMIRVEMGLEDARQLCLDSLGWNEAGMTTLWMRLGARKVGSEKFIALEMSLPLSIVQKNLTASTAGTSSVLVLSQTAVDEDQLSDDDEGPMAKKARIDDALEEIYTKILTRYPKDSCKDHPDVHCFYHALTKQHFDVGYRPAALMWAAKIRLEADREVKTVDITRIPLGLGFFTPKHALKIPKKKPESESEQSAASPAIDSTIALHLSQLSANQAQLQMMLLSGQGGFSPFTPRTPVPAAYTSAPDTTRSLSPPLPENSLSLVEFCQQHKFNDDVLKWLQKMEFKPGDNLASIMRDQWLEVGFTELSWKRVMKANRSYRKMLQAEHV